MHNAHLCPDLGYYYKDNDVRNGAAQLGLAIREHDVNAEAYRRQQRELIARYLPGNPTMTEHYTQLLKELIARPAR